MSSGFSADRPAWPWIEVLTDRFPGAPLDRQLAMLHNARAHPAAMTPLAELALAHDHPLVREQALIVLGASCDPRTEAWALQGLTDTDPHVVLRAVGLLDLVVESSDP